MRIDALELLEPEIRFLESPEVPSFRTRVRLRNGESCLLYAVHPEPPLPHADTLKRDSELILIARDVKRDTVPGVVTGDLNDVAWSRTTARFQRLSGYLDPRVGRGLYSSFDARFPLARWPLDHLFHHPRFRLVRLERLPYVGSDHFPMLFSLALVDRPGANSAPRAPDERDLREARDTVAQADELQRPAIGTDME